MSAARTGSAAGLASGFNESAERFPDRPALEVDGHVLSYAELQSWATAIAVTLNRAQPTAKVPLTAVWASRTRSAFGGVLAALLRGHGYVPLNPSFPAERTRAMLERSGCGAIVADRHAAEQLEQVIRGEGMVILLPEVEDVSSLAARLPEHVVLGARDLASPDAFGSATAGPGELAYLLFTSGSTGEPKGAAVAQRNVTAFVDAVSKHYDFDESDRFSQTFDMTFDLSAFDMFVAWRAGACVSCPSGNALIKPNEFINRAELTVWFSVPSVAIFMKRLGALKPGRYPTLRWSLFCGEPLPVEVASAWSQAAPASMVENLYGPTELTIACTVYRWDPRRSPGEAAMGVVPIGFPLAGMEPLIVDDNLAEVAPGKEGELLMTGPQLTLGYWNDPARTAQAFVVPPGRDRLYYRTGDRVRRPTNPDEPLLYIGRVDHQIKVNGHRVELGEVEAVVRRVAGVDGVVAIGWPRTAAGFGGVAAFVQADVEVEPLRRALLQELPHYMVPREIHTLEKLPLNANGKFDRRVLAAMLEEPKK